MAKKSNKSNKNIVKDYAYIKVRVQFGESISPAKIEEVLSEVDYSVVSQTKGVKITATEIVETSDNYEFKDED